MNGSCRTWTLICMLLMPLACPLSGLDGFTLCRHSPWTPKRKKMNFLPQPGSQHTSLTFQAGFCSSFSYCKCKSRGEAHFAPTCQRSHTVLSCAGQQGRACIEIHFLISPTHAFQPPRFRRTLVPLHLLITAGSIVPAAWCKKGGRQVLTENSGKHYLNWRGTLQIDY